MKLLEARLIVDSSDDGHNLPRLIITVELQSKTEELGAFAVVMAAQFEPKPEIDIRIPSAFDEDP